MSEEHEVSVQFGGEAPNLEIVMNFEEIPLHELFISVVGWTNSPEPEVRRICEKKFQAIKLFEERIEQSRNNTVVV